MLAFFYILAESDTVILFKSAKTPEFFMTVGPHYSSPLLATTAIFPYLQFLTHAVQTSIKNVHATPIPCQDQLKAG